MIKQVAVFILLIVFSCKSTEPSVNIDEEIKNFFKENNLDKRTTYFDVSLENGVLEGVAQNQKLIDDFGGFVNEVQGKEFLNNIQVLNNQPAYIRNSVSNARSNPKHSAELATQYLMGQKVNLIKTDESGDWHYIQGPDNYLAWIDAGGILTKEETSVEWLKREKVKIQANEIVGVSRQDKHIATDLVFGNTLAKNGNYYITPDGTEISVPSSAFLREGYLPDGLNPQTSIQQVLEKAYSLMGRPYLWGGTSTKGMDCSGFTRTAFMNADYLLGRDASLQVHEGEEVDKNKMADWKVGDLLFFGNLREDGSQRITHVAIHTGNGNMIHASQRVREESLNPKSEKYNKQRAESLLRVKRIF